MRLQVPYKLVKACDQGCKRDVAVWDRDLWC